MASTDIKKPPQTTENNYVRTIFASLFGFFAISLIITSILVIWINRTLTNTDQYVKTVAPLVTNPEVQDFVVTSISDALLENDGAPVKEIATQILGNEKIAGMINEQLKLQVKPIVEENLKSVVASDEFAKLWEQSNREVHSQLIAQLEGDSEDFTLNFNPLIAGVFDQLGTTKLGFIKEQIELGPEVGVVKFEGANLDGMRNAYNYFQNAMLAIIGCAILSLVLCVLISVHHLKTLRRVALAVGVFAGILAASLSATTLIKSDSVNAEQKVAIAVVDATTHQLRISLIIISVICIAIAVGSKVYAVFMERKNKT